MPWGLDSSRVMRKKMENDDESVRIRVVFENILLTNSHISEGLNQCWILLKPQKLPTVSDLSSHLLRTFHLHQSADHGLLLSMDGFVLPPFESTCILRDNDIISVKKKGITLLDAIEEGGTGKPVLELEMAKKEGDEEGETDIEDNKIEYALPVKSSSGSKSVTKKRKQSKEPHSSNKKKRRLVVADAVENDVLTENIQDHQTVGVAAKVAEEIIENGGVESDHLQECNDHLQECDEGNNDVIPAPEGTKKVPSRSARRKYATRKWLKELKKAEKECAPKICVDKMVEGTAEDNDSCPPNRLLNRKWERGRTKKKETVNLRPKGLLHWKKLPGKELQNDKFEEDEQPSSDVVDDVVAVVVKPGHIRFETPGKEHAIIPSPVTVWSGSTNTDITTNNKKGRKNRKEKKSSSGGIISKQDLERIHAQALASEKDLLIDFPTDLESLPPLTTVAEEGDVIAYRLVELSSSWTPELSSFRVGKILWCDSQSTKIVMKPISQKKDENGNSEIQSHPDGLLRVENGNSEIQSHPDGLLCNENDNSEIQSHPDGLLRDVDGNLEIDFKVLIDVRVIKHGDSVPAEPSKAGKKEENPWERLMNREIDPWERLSQASSYASRTLLYGM